MLLVPQPFDGQHFLAGDGCRQQDASAHRFAVNYDSAGLPGLGQR